MEFSRPVPFPEQAAPEQLVFFCPMLLGLRTLNSHNVPIEDLPVFDVNPSLLTCGTVAPLQQLAHLPSMSWSTTEPALPLNPYTCHQANGEDTAFHVGYLCQEYSDLESVDHTLALEEIGSIGNVYQNLLESSFCMDAMPCNSTDALAAMAQSDALFMHNLATDDCFSWPLLEPTYQFFPSHCTNQAIPSFLGSNSSRSSLDLRQETTQYISNIGSSHSSTGMHFMCPLPSQILNSELDKNLYTRMEQDKLAICLTSDNQVQQYFAEGHTEAKFSQWMQNDVNQSLTNFQGECMPQANSTGSVVSSSVLTDADTESSVHSERPLASQFVKRHLQSNESSEIPFTSSWGSAIFKEYSDHDHSESIKCFVTSDLPTLGSSLATLAPPVKRKKECFAMETVSKSVDRHSRDNYSQELEGKRSVTTRYSSQPGTESSDELTKPQYCQHFLRQQATGRSNLSPTGECDKRNSQRKPCLTSIEPQSMAARQRRKKISERVRTLETLVPGGDKLDTASMLDEAIKYVKFLQLQIQILESLGNEINNGNSAQLMARENSCADNIYTSESSMQSLTALPQPPTSPLVLTEVLQHQLFKSGYCLMSLQQCPSSSSRAP